MDNIVSYAEKTLNSFADQPFSSVDSLILSWVSYFRFPEAMAEIRTWNGIRLAELFQAEHFAELFRNNWDPASSRSLLTAMAASPRFRNIRVMGYTERRDAAAEKQFAAVSFQISEDLCYIAFRGTDSTLIGWKEDFNMAFQYPVPAQADAALYLEEAAEHCSGTILVGGHSKGGNLAVYAAANSTEPFRGRIGAVYSHDGPGFLDSVLKSEAFTSISAKINKTVPQSSLIGMLLEHQESFQIVKSTRFSVWQHDPFSWVIEDDHFSFVSDLTSDAKYLDHVLNQWLTSLTREERERFVDLLFSLVDTDNIETTAQLRAQWQKNIPLALHAASNLDSETKEFAGRAIKALLSLSVKSFPEIWKAQ